MVLKLAELTGGMINGETGMVDRAVDSRAMLIPMFRAMGPLMTGDEMMVTTTDVTTGVKLHAGGVEVLATKMWAGAESWNR